MGRFRDTGLAFEEKFLEIAERRIGFAYEPYIVAELSANHNGKLARALAIMEAAKEAGADAVKLQTYTADRLTLDYDGPDFCIKGGLWDGRKLYDLYREAALPLDWHETLFAKGRELGITVFSSPFDDYAVDLLEELDAPAYKIASFELVDLGLIRKVAATGKPLIISTGMADLEEIGEALTAAYGAGCTQIILLHCISAYPAPTEDTNLRVIEDLRQRFGLMVGLSDHSMGTTIAVAAVALGAPFIEKHFTLDRSDGGLDSAFSLERAELKELVSSSKRAWRALGHVCYRRSAGEKGNVIFRRSIYVVEDILAGDCLTERNIRSIRPGYGLAPKHLPDVLGRRAIRDLPRGTALSWADLVPFDETTA